MTRSRVYPKANRVAQWWEKDFARGTFTAIDKVLLHTTETTGWPGYAAGSMAPTLTYHPTLRAWRQHNYLDRSARALLDPAATAVRENRDNVIQIEIVAYSDEKIAQSVGGLAVVNLTDAQLQDIADFLVYIRAEWGGPPLLSASFKHYPESAGINNGVRMSGPQYDAFKGILGHMHAPGQGHGDPSTINVKRIIQLATPAAPKPPLPTTPTNPTSPTGDLNMDEATVRKIIAEELAKAAPAIATKVWTFKNPDLTTRDAYSFLRDGKDSGLKPVTNPPTTN
jgi:hypothetical protein